MSHDSVKHCWMVLSTLNGNVSLGQRSMALHMELQHAHRKVVLGVCMVCPVDVCVRGLGQSVESRCVVSFQLVVTSPNRTGSHALLIQSPWPPRAIEPISSYISPSRTLAHPCIWTVSWLRHWGVVWHWKTSTLTCRRRPDICCFVCFLFCFFIGVFFLVPLTGSISPVFPHLVLPDLQLFIVESSHTQLTCTMIYANRKLTRPRQKWMSH